MEYGDALSYIESKNSLGIVPGLDVILALLKKLGNPELAVPALHIAGTNGKGTVMSYVEQAMLQHGLKVGRYLSPAVLDYREKWHVNGEMASKEDVAECMEEVWEAAESLPHSPTVFEIETALAFVLFRKKKCDVMLVECGMGGRQDATNVIPSKIVDILASVSLDHMQFLGDTREKILREKLGIVRPGDVLATAPMDEELRRVLDGWMVPVPGEDGETVPLRRAEADRGELTILCEEIDGTDFSYRGENYHIRMAGDVAVDNAITALTALELYNERAGQFGLPKLTREEIRAGLAETSWQGRFTVFDTHPRMIIDGAHNRDAWLRLAGTLKRVYGEKRLTFVLGVLADKEVDVLIETMVPMAKRIYTFTPESPRALAGEKLRQRILDFREGSERTDAEGKTTPAGDPDEHDLQDPCAAVGDREFAVCMENALIAAETALREAAEDDVIVACGSLTFLGKLLENREHLEMERVTRILEDRFYRKQIKKIYESEYDREFCRHGFGHAVSVARIAYILALEEKRKLRKDVIYAAALLHDIGRYTQEEKTMSHHEAGAVVAADVLRRAGYTEAECTEICEAIRAHKEPEDSIGTLAAVLYRADKLSRNCFLCDAREECYWPENRKNRTILC